MSRNELYKKVRELDAAAAIKAKFGDNFTRVSNLDLEAFLKGFEKKITPEKKVTKATAKETKGTGSAVVKLLSILQTKKVITAKEAEEVAELL